MKVRVALALLVLAGCGSDTPGMRLDVRDGGTGAVRVELYLGRAKCPECADIQPAIAQDKLHGDGYFLDGSATAGTPETAVAMDGGRAVFELRAPDVTDTALPVVVILGLDAQDQVVAAQKLVDVPVPHADTVWWKIDLEPATAEVATDTATPAGQRVQVWRRTAPDTAACVGYEYSDGHNVTRTWLVPEDDPDCDEFPAAVDCDKLAYHAMGTAAIGAARCVTDQYTIPKTTGTTCLLGGNACVDGTPSVNSTTCARVAPYYCVPDLLCTNSSCRSAPVQCITNLSVTQMQCDMPYDAATGVPCTDASTAPTIAQLDSFFIHPSDPEKQVKCHDVNFADITFMKPILSKVIKRGSLQLHADNVVANSTCAVPITFDSNENVLDGTPPLATFADLELTNNRHILLPFVFEFHPVDCAMAGSARCVPVPANTETLTNCTTPDP